MVTLPPPAPAYDTRDQAETRRLLQQADRENYKRGEDIEVRPGQRVIMADEATGARGLLTVVSGVLTWTALPS